MLLVLLLGVSLYQKSPFFIIKVELYPQRRERSLRARYRGETISSSHIAINKAALKSTLSHPSCFIKNHSRPLCNLWYSLLRHMSHNSPLANGFGSLKYRSCQAVKYNLVERVEPIPVCQTRESVWLKESCLNVYATTTLAW